MRSSVCLSILCIRESTLNQSFTMF